MGIEDSDIPPIADFLRTDVRVKELHLHMNEIGDEGAMALAEVLRTNTSLTRLELGANFIGDAGMGELGRALAGNTSLEYLGLSESRITDAGLRAFAEGIAGNTTLTRLDLRFDKGVTDESFRVIEILVMSSAMTFASLCTTSMTEEMCETVYRIQRIQRSQYRERGLTFAASKPA